MPLLTTLASLSQTPASNAADGSVDAPSTLDNQVNLLASFIAQLRDGNGFTTGVANVGQCRLTKSGANLLLSPFMGNGLTINGVVQKIPSAGVTLAPGALSVGTTYYIYAYMVSTVMTLEAVTTGHSTDTVTGVEIKTGDVTRTLVGMARTITGPAWQDATNQRFVSSWFNRRPLSVYSVLGSNAGIASVSAVEIATALRTEFLIWSMDTARFVFEGSATNNVANAISSTALSLDGVLGESYSAWQSYVANSYGPVACSLTPFSPSEGYHYVSPFALQNVVSTTLYTGTGSVGLRCVNSGLIQG